MNSSIVLNVLNSLLINGSLVLENGAGLIVAPNAQIIVRDCIDVRNATLTVQLTSTGTFNQTVRYLLFVLDSLLLFLHMS